VRLERHMDEYEVSLENAKVNLVLLDFRLGINALEADRGSLQIVISSSFSTRVGSGMPAVTLDPEDASPALGALAVAVRFQELRKCHIKDGTLMLEFGSGQTIEVPPNTDYEAWQLDGTDFKIIATPGGELAIWDETQR